MGIPGLFANLSYKYKKHIIKTKLNSNQNTNSDCEIEQLLEDPNNFINVSSDMLFFDFNCLIHPVCRLLWTQNLDSSGKTKFNSIEDFEDKLMKECIKYLEMVVNYAKPTELIAVYIDGICPMSKMAQQRQRRFASVIDKEIYNNIKSKFGVTLEETYDTNSITPGTKFMENFDKYLKNYFENKNKLGQQQYIYSSFNEIGEGEHKIIRFIEDKFKSSDLKNKNIIIYGLDADLIILNLILYGKIYKNGNNIMLLRENDKFSLDELNMIYFDIGAVAKCISDEFTICNTKNESNRINDINFNLVNDFIFITLILGNDFIQPCPSVNMRFNKGKSNGYEMLVKQYMNTKLELYENNADNEYIIHWQDLSVNNSSINDGSFADKFSINWKLFKTLINKLATYEQHYFENINKFRHKSNEDNDPANEQIDRLNHLMFKFPDPIKISKKEIPYEERKKRYIHHYFGSKACICKKNNKSFMSSLLLDNVNMTDDFYDDKELELNIEILEKIIKIYLSTFSYVLYYYYRGCPDYLYYYKFLTNPLLSQVYDYLEKTDDNELNSIMNKFYKQSNNKMLLNPIVQLLTVLPYKSFNLLPRNVERHIMSDINKNNIHVQIFKNTFPDKPKRDFILKSKLHQANFVLDIPEINNTVQLVSDIYKL